MTTAVHNMHEKKLFRTRNFSQFISVIESIKQIYSFAQYLLNVKGKSAVCRNSGSNVQMVIQAVP